MSKPLANPVVFSDEQERFFIETWNDNRTYEALIKDEAGNNHQFSVHRLVAQAFIPNPENKPQVDHIDSNPLNNAASNLQWVTQEEQLNNAESQKKRQVADEKRQKRWKMQPLIVRRSDYWKRLRRTGLW